MHRLIRKAANAFFDIATTFRPCANTRVSANTALVAATANRFVRENHLSTTKRFLRTNAKVAASLVLSVFTTIVRADGNCAREPTTAENDYHQRAVAALAALIPATPANMTLRGKPYDFKTPPRIAGEGSPCSKDRKDRSWEIAHGASYLFTWPKADQDRRYAERRQLLDQIAALETLPLEQAARHQQLSEQSRAAYNSQPKRARRSDPELSAADRKLAEEKVAEGRALEEQAKAIERTHRAGVKPRTEPLRIAADALQPSVVELLLTFRMNTNRLATADASAAIASVGSPSPDGSLKASNVSATITGPQFVPIPPGAPRQALFDAIDQSRMRALLGRPLPSVAESEAAAARLENPPRKSP